MKVSTSKARHKRSPNIPSFTLLTELREASFFDTVQVKSSAAVCLHLLVPDFSQLVRLYLLLAYKTTPPTPPTPASQSPPKQDGLLNVSEPAINYLSFVEDKKKMKMEKPPSSIK